MLYFPYLINALCKRHGVHEKTVDEVSNPQEGFDKAIILNLLKPKDNKKVHQQRRNFIGTVVPLIGCFRQNNTGNTRCHL